jgi:hypothetical protein
LALAVSWHRVSYDGLSKTTCRGLPITFGLVMLQNPDSFGARLKRPKEMDEVAHWQMLDVVQFHLGAGEIEEQFAALL